MIDAHVHTHFSADSEANPELYILEALKKGIRHLTFTDHMDLLYPHDTNFEFDTGAFDALFEVLHQKYQSQIHLYRGVELGLQKKCILDAQLFVESFKPDFVLCSLHTVEDEDLYYGNFFKRHAPEEAMKRYLLTLRDIVDRFKDFNVLGHLDLPKRYCPEIYQVPANRYMGILDDIFDILFSRQQGIEINTSGLRGPHKRPFPDYEILGHYLNRGGKILTFGSDSHQEDTLGSGYDLVKAFLKSHNVKSLFVYKQMEGFEVPL